MSTWMGDRRRGRRLLLPMCWVAVWPPGDGPWEMRGLLHHVSEAVARKPELFFTPTALYFLFLLRNTLLCVLAFVFQTCLMIPSPRMVVNFRK